MTQSDAEHALDYAELRHVPTEDEIGYESLPYSPEKLRQIKEYLDNPGPYNAQSRQSTEGRYARAILADLIDARAELQAERERVRQMEEALRHLREGIGTLINTQLSIRDELPEDYHAGQSKVDARIEAYNDVLRVFDAAFSESSSQLEK